MLPDRYRPFLETDYSASWDGDWFEVDRDPEDHATAFGAEALLMEVDWTAYMCRLDISCDCVYCGLVG